MRIRSSVFAFLAAVLLAAGPGAAAAAAQGWSGAATLGQDGTSTVGDVAIDPDETAIVAWAAENGPVRAAVRPARGTFGSAVTLAFDGGRPAAVALDGRGGALVAWSRNGTLGLAERTAGTPLAQVPTGAAGIAAGPDVAFTGPGQAIVVWAGTDGAVHALSRTLGGATVPLPDVAAGPGNANAFVDAAGGHAVVAWTHVVRDITPPGELVTTRVRASALAPGGSLAPLRTW